MPDNVAYRGQKFTIYFAIRQNGSMPASEFLASQEFRWQARIHHLFKIIGDIGFICNDEQFKKFEEPFYEFKAFQIRMPCYFRDGGCVVVTHGFIKKKRVQLRNKKQSELEASNWNTINGHQENRQRESANNEHHI